MTSAVLLSAHGTVKSIEELPAFLTRIRRGKPPSEALLAEVTRRYVHIGRSPLLDNTLALARALEAELSVPVVVGMRLSEPSIDAAIAEAKARGATRVVSLPLAPQSVHVYHAAVARAASGLPVVEVPPWGEEPLLLDAFSRAIDAAVARSLPGAALVLTAHSLPTAILRAGDPYERDVRAMCAALVARRGESRDVRVAFQSQGLDGGEWLGPTLDDTLRALAHGGARDVIVAAVGFLSDHVETLYDLDVEAKALADSLGLRLARAPSLDASPALVAALAAVARRALA